MTHDLEEPALEQEVERALAPYRGAISPEALEEMRQTLRLILATHPTAQHLLRQLRPRHVEQSGPTPTGVGADSDLAAKEGRR